MPPYKKMYTELFNAVTDAIERLQCAQQHCEELYMDSGEDNTLTIVDKAELPLND